MQIWLDNFHLLVLLMWPSIGFLGVISLAGFSEYFGTCSHVCCWGLVHRHGHVQPFEGASGYEQNGKGQVSPWIRADHSTAVTFHNHLLAVKNVILHTQCQRDAWMQYFLQPARDWFCFWVHVLLAPPLASSLFFLRNSSLPPALDPMGIHQLV